MTWTLEEATPMEYSRNALVATICQMQFDPILKIHDSVPDFQERIRDRFPGYETNESKTLDVDLASGAFNQRIVRQHRFRARGTRSTVTLSDGSLAVEYLDHKRRDVLHDDVVLIADAFRNVYLRAPVKRLGVRYVNLIRRSTIATDLGEDVEWSDLSVIPVDDEVESRIEQYLSAVDPAGESLPL